MDSAMGNQVENVLPTHAPAHRGGQHWDTIAFMRLPPTLAGLMHRDQPMTESIPVLSAWPIAGSEGTYMHASGLKQIQAGHGNRTDLASVALPSALRSCTRISISPGCPWST